jgi:Raf kinase inhibitor-like YbhB/YbcL family protein
VTDFRLTSTAFADGATIPRRHTADGIDASPPLAWTGAPAGTRSFVLVVCDPDAPKGTWFHWLLYDIPPATQELREERPRAHFIDGARQGRSSWGRIGWNGPAPPPGAPHRYVFTIRAIDRVLGLEPGATPAELAAAIEGHVLAEASLIGKYGR